MVFEEPKTWADFLPWVVLEYLNGKKHFGKDNGTYMTADVEDLRLEFHAACRDHKLARVALLAYAFKLRGLRIWDNGP